MTSKSIVSHVRIAIASALFILGITILSIALTGPTVLAAAGGSSGRAVVKGSKPSWATSANYVGAAASTAQVGFRVYLSWNNSSGAEALARSVSNPSSSLYRHYLSPTQFRQKFRSEEHTSELQSRRDL